MTTMMKIITVIIVTRVFLLQVFSSLFYQAHDAVLLFVLLFKHMFKLNPQRRRSVYLQRWQNWERK